MANQINIKIPDVFHGLYTDARYYVYYGGRGSGKSWSIAQYLICMALSQPLKILCTREFQNSILESVYSLLKGIISRYKLGQWFNCKLNTIECYNGSVFIFKGLAHNIESVKSTEGIDLCWIEEADKVSQTSWDTLIPTIRKPNSKIIVTFNPTNEDDPVYSMFITSPPGDAVVQKVNYNDNPHFPAVLEKEMLHLKATDYEKYMHVWEGQLRTISDAQVFKNKFVVDTFDSKEMGIENFYHGMDFGFANDPSAVVRLFIKGRDLFIEHECFGHGVEINELSALINKVIAGRHYRIYGDCSRPETISYLRNEGWNIEGAKKWSGSVEDGVEFLRQFDKIVLHPRCTNLLQEFKRYSFKVDKRTTEILPIVVDAWNHGIDACRYSLDALIQRKFSIYDDGVF